MTTARVLCSTIAALAALAPLHAQTQRYITDIQLQSLQLTNIGTDTVEAAIQISAIANTSATLQTLVLDSVTINGVRVRFPPVIGPIGLRAGEPLQGLPTLRASLTVRELASLGPLRRAIRDGAARVHADVHAQLQLSLFQKLMLRSAAAWVTTTVDQDVPVFVPGGAIGRFAATAALTLANPLWIAGTNALGSRRNQSSLAEQARAWADGHLFAIDTGYRLKSRNGDITTLHHQSLGFLVREGELLAPAEAAEPWNFDDKVAEALARGDATLDKSSVEIFARAGEPIALQLIKVLKDREKGHLHRNETPLSRPLSRERQQRGALSHFRLARKCDQ